MSKFVLTAQLQLQAPTNTIQVINQLRSQLEGQVNIPVSVTGGTQATRQIKEVTKRTREATTAADKMGKAFGASIKKFAAFNIATRAVGLLASKLSSAVDEAIEFQRQLVKISQVTGKTTGQLSGLTQEITRLSTTLGVSSTSLLQTTRVLAQAGIKAGDLKVALEALAKTTLAPTFDDIAETAEGAVAILAQFGEGVGALEKQLGAINAVSKRFAVESGDLISSVRRMGGVFKSAGGDLNELIGLFTSVRATTRENSESIATGLRTIFTRIQRPTTIAYLKQLGVELTDLDGKFVGPFEAVKRLSQAFADIPAGDLRFVQIAEELGGFRQIGKVIPLIQQFTIAERARQTAIAGGDSLNKDAITAQQALAVQIEKTREKFLALIRGISETSSFQIMIKSLLGMANAFIKVAESIKPLIPLITVFAGLKLAKGIGGFARGLGAGVRGKNQGGKIHAFASGGSVPGTGNRDTVPAMLTPGEFVIRKSSVNKIGTGTLAAMNENKYAGGGIAKENKLGIATPDVVGSNLEPIRNKVKLKTIQPKGSEGPLNKKTGFGKLAGKTIYGLYEGKGDGKLPKAEIDKIAVETIGTQKTYDTIIEGVTKNDSDAFNEIANTSAQNAMRNAASKWASTVGVTLKPEEITYADKFEIPGGFKGELFEGVLDAFNGRPIGEAASESRRPFDFINGVKPQGTLFNLLNKEGVKYVDAKASKSAATVKGEFDKKLVNQTADDLVNDRLSVGGEFLTSIQKRIKELQEDRAKKNASNKNKAQSPSPLNRAAGGSISGSTDTVPAMLTPGEFVVNKKASQSIGYGNLNRMNKQGVVGYASGGAVGVQYFGEGSPGGVQGVAGFDIVEALRKVISEAKQVANKEGPRPGASSDFSGVKAAGKKAQARSHPDSAGVKGIEDEGMKELADQAFKTVTDLRDAAEAINESEEGSKEMKKAQDSLTDAYYTSKEILEDLKQRASELWVEEQRAAKPSDARKAAQAASAGNMDVIAARTPTKAVAVAAPTAAPADARKSDVSAMKKSSKKAAAKKDDCKCEKMAAADCKCEYEAAQRIVAAIANSTGKIVIAIQKSGGGPVETVKPQEAAEVQVEERKEERKETDDKKDDKKESGGFGAAEKFLLFAGVASTALGQFADDSTEAGQMLGTFNDALLAGSTSFAAVSAVNKAWIERSNKAIADREKAVSDNLEEQRAGATERDMGIGEEMFEKEEKNKASLDLGAARSEKVRREAAAVEKGDDNLTLEGRATETAAAQQRAQEDFERKRKKREEVEYSPGFDGPTGSRDTMDINALQREMEQAEQSLKEASDAATSAATAHQENADAIRAEEANIEGAKKRQEKATEGITAAQEKQTAGAQRLNKALKDAPSKFRRAGLAFRKFVNKLQNGLKNVAAVGTAALSAVISVLDKLSESSKKREEEAIKSGDFKGARDEFDNQQEMSGLKSTLGAAASGAMLGSIFGPLGTIVGALVGLLTSYLDIMNKVLNKEKAREKHNQKIADAAIAQSKEKNVDLEKAFLGKGGSTVNKNLFGGTKGGERREIFAREAGLASRAAGTEVKKVKDPEEKQKRVEQLAAEEVRMVGIIASRATTEEEAIAAIAGFDDEVGATKDELIKAAKASYALAAAQRALTKANYDSLKVTSTFNAANLALKGFVSSLDSGTSSLDGYIEIIEASQKNLGIDASASIEKAATELASNPNLSQGAKDTIDRQKETALKVNDFGLKIGQEIQNLDLSASSPEEAKAQLESKLIGAAGGDKDLESVIRSELANVQGNVADADISTIISGIQSKAGQLSAGFIESAKIMNDSNKIITDLTNKRRASELKLIETQKQAIETQIEASKIIAEFGGDKFTPQQETAARVKQFNLSSRDAGVGGLTTGSAVDIGNVSAQLQAEFKNQQGRVINQAAGGAKAFGEPTQQIDEDKRKELASAQKELIGFTKQRVAQLREELSIIQKKNKLEKDSLEALVTGDIEGFLKGQAAAGAGAAIRSGNTSLLGNFDSEAIGKAFQDAKASGLTGDELRPFAEAGLNARGITSTSSIDTLAGTTAQEQAVMEEGRRLGQVLGGLADQLVELDSMNVTAANVTIQTANRKRDQAIQKQNALFSSGGVVYANRGIFVPRGTDTIPAMLTPGEFVVNRASVQRGNNLAILQAMNNGQQAAPGPAMNRGGSVRYYSNGSDGGVQPGGGGVGISAETVTSLNNVFTMFDATVDKLKQLKLSVQLDPSTINVNFNNTSFLSSLTTTINEAVLKEVKNQIPNIKQNMAGENTLDPAGASVL